MLEQCRAAGLIDGRTVHADSTLLRADASLDGRVSRVLWEQLEQDADAGTWADDSPTTAGDDGDAPLGDGGGGGGGGTDTGTGTGTDTNTDTGDGKRRAKLNDRLVSPVDPDAATSTRRTGGTTLGYRDHRLVDDRRGIVLATIATPADVDDGAMLPELLMRQRDYTDTTPDEVVADSMYGTRDNYALLERERVKAYLKKRRGKDSPKVSWLKLLPPGCSPRRALHLLARRKSRAEGSFAEAHVRMNHRRCRWRTRWRVQVQCYLVAAAQNLKKLANHLFHRSPVMATKRTVLPELAMTLGRCAA